MTTPADAADRATALGLPWRAFVRDPSLTLNTVLVGGYTTVGDASAWVAILHDARPGDAEELLAVTADAEENPHAHATRDP